MFPCVAGVYAIRGRFRGLKFAGVQIRALYGLKKERLFLPGFAQSRPYSPEKIEKLFHSPLAIFARASSRIVSASGSLGFAMTASAASMTVFRDSAAFPRALMHSTPMGCQPEPTLINWAACVSEISCEISTISPTRTHLKIR